MNIFEARKALMGKKTAEQHAILLQVGMPESKIPDYLEYLNVRKTSGKTESRYNGNEKLTESEHWAKIRQRSEQMAEMARLNPPGQVVWTPPIEPRGIQRHILHNQFLMGGSTAFDNASLLYPQLIQTEVIRWLEDKFIPGDRRAALLLGDTGTGKTWGAIAYLNAVSKLYFRDQIVSGSNSAFITAFRLAEMFANQKKFQEALAEIIHKDNLLIDDLGAEPSGYRGADFVAYFDHIFSERHMHKRRTIITSNATKAQIREVYGARFTSRFNDIGAILETRAKDMRGE